MAKFIKICGMAGLCISLLLMVGCDEEQSPAAKLKDKARVVSKSISKVAPKPSIQNQSDQNGKEGQKTLDQAGKKPGLSKGGASPEFLAEFAKKANIAKPLAKYDSKGRVDPFVPLISERDKSSAPVTQVSNKPKRELTPLEKLSLSQLTLVAVVEMPGQTIAMVEEASGKGYEVTLGTYIGKNSGRVTAITSNSVKIEETIKDYKGNLRKHFEEIKFHKSEDGE